MSADANQPASGTRWSGYANDRAPGVIAIVGPTASGKSTLGIEVALRLGGEIINCDSVQVYQGIQIATAKVPFAERRGIPHHLIDFVSPKINYTAGDWAREAAPIIEDIQRRGRVPILVGGTGLYLRAFRNPFFPARKPMKASAADLTSCGNDAEPSTFIVCCNASIRKAQQNCIHAIGLACNAPSKFAYRLARQCRSRRVGDRNRTRAPDTCA